MISDNNGEVTTAEGSIPASWAIAPIAAIAEIGPKFDADGLYDDQAVHFVPMAAAKEDFGGIDVSQLRPLREVRKGYTAFAQGDVLFAKITPCMENGKGGLVPHLPNRHAFGSTEFHVLRPRAPVAAKWLAHYLSQPDFRKTARHNMTGTAGQLRVPTKWLATVDVPVPPLAEQARIVVKLEELLSDLDAGVAELKAAQRKLQQYRQSLLKAAVEGTLTAAWREQNPPQEGGAELLARILVERRAHWEAKQLARFAEQGKAPPNGWQAKYPEPVAPDISELPELPGGWVWASLDMLGEIVSGVAKGTKRDEQVPVREVPYLRVANVQRGYLDLSEVKTILATERDIEELTLKSGDALFNEGGDRDKLGRGWVWRDQVANCIHQNHVFRMRPYLSETLPEFISHHGNTFGKTWFQKAGKQTTNLASINMSMLRSFPVPVASATEQLEILAQLERHFEVLNAQENSVERGLKQSTAQRQNILRAAFAGQLVPQDPDDEPARVLLERIRAERQEKETAGTRKRMSRKRT